MICVLANQFYKYVLYVIYFYKECVNKDVLLIYK